MKRTSFKHPTLDEVRAKQAAKGLKLPQVKSKPKKATKTQAQLKKDLDAIFSKYIRRKYPARCYTCGKIDTPLQCGHFVSRQYLATRWDENNCRPQCVGCNIYGNGKPLDFEENLKKELGEQFVEQMKASRHQSLKLDLHWYEAEIAKYKLLITQ
jgi:5-methylcytosine-specific restriction endonuclease McrA